MLTLLASLSKEFKPLITALDAVGHENVSKKKVKNMLLNDTDRTSDSKTVEGVFLQNKIGIEEEIKTNETMTRQKVPVFKGKCHSCLEKDMHYAPDCPKTKKNTERTNRKGKDGSACSVLRQKQ